MPCTLFSSAGFCVSTWTDAGLGLGVFAGVSVGFDDSLNEVAQHARALWCVARLLAQPHGVVSFRDERLASGEHVGPHDSAVEFGVELYAVTPWSELDGLVVVAVGVGEGARSAR